MAGRRPIEAWEEPHLRALAVDLRALVATSGLSIAAWGRAAEIGSGLFLILSAKRRTRRSTLARLVAAVVPESEREQTLDRLCAVAGPALAPESIYAERTARRKERRKRHAERLAAIQEEATERATERIAAEARERALEYRRQRGLPW